MNIESVLGLESGSLGDQRRAEQFQISIFICSKCRKGRKIK